MLRCTQHLTDTEREGRAVLQMPELTYTETAPLVILVVRAQVKVQVHLKAGQRQQV